MAENVLYYGDNLEILRRYIKDESIDLVHLDPPFKSDQDYNILFAERNGSQPALNNSKCKIRKSKRHIKIQDGYLFG
jgi:site-specific DNA-methyltransferase (adenine-specific)